MPPLAATYLLTSDVGTHTALSKESATGGSALEALPLGAEPLMATFL